MYNVIIVDDENIVLKGLSSFIDWEKYGFKITGQCRSGSQAWDLCRKTEPELVITDIRMNDGDGLTLIDNIRASDLQTEVIILTGFEDFHVAKSAIEHNVHQILLKPLKEEELCSALISVKEKIDRHKSNRKIMKSYINYNNARLLHRLLNEPDLNEASLAEISATYSTKLPTSSYLIALIHIDAPENPAYEKLHISLIDVINNVSLTDEHFMIANMLSNKNIPLLIYEQPESGIAGILKVLHEIKSEFRRITGHSLTIGTSLIFRSINAISRAFDQAKTSLEYIHYFGNDCIIDYAHLPGENGDELLPFSQNDILSLCGMIKKFDTAGATEVINSYFAKIPKIRNVNINDVRNNILELAIFILKENVFNTVALSEVFGRTLVPAIELQQFDLVSDIHKWILDVVTKLTEHPEVFISNTYSSTVQNAIIYTMANYSEPLTAAFVAKQLYLSSNHFMRLFKKEVGKTYGEYLTEYRISMAKKFLKSNSYKVYEIGKMVGYPNTKYFNRIFKKYTGHVPSYYSKEVE